MALQRYDTAEQIIDQVAAELGLGNISGAFSSQDANIIKLTFMLTSVGCELSKRYDWEHLTREFAIDTVSGQQTYNLPIDYLRMVPDTVWDTTLVMPIAGPLGHKEFQELTKGWPGGGTMWLSFRAKTTTIDFVPVTLFSGASHHITFEMRSKSWVWPAGITYDDSVIGNGTTLGETGHDYVETGSDRVLFDALLARAALKLAWKRDTGFDTTQAEADFLRALEYARGTTTASGNVYLTTRRRD